MELDQFVKELIGDFLPEVTLLFFPCEARILNFSLQKDLNKELYTKSPGSGGKRYVDILFEVPHKNPPPEIMLIHVESQQQKRFDFPARMLGYHCLIYEREIERERQDSFSLVQFTGWENKKRLLSFVLCNYAIEDGIKEDKVDSPQTMLSCQYTTISLPVLPAREYLRKDNPVVCALAVFMNPDGLSKPELKVECYQKLLSYKENLTTRQMNLIVYALETYLILTEEEKQIYQRLIKEVYPEVSEMIINPLIEQGIKQGIQQGEKIGLQQGERIGLQQGERLGLQKSIVRLLSRRFPQIPDDLQKKIFALVDTQKLEMLFDASFEAESLDELTKNGFWMD